MQSSTGTPRNPFAQNQLKTPPQFYRESIWFMIPAGTVPYHEGVPMRIFPPAAIALALLIAGCAKKEMTYIPDTRYDYSGEWTLKWVDSDSRHPVSLAQKENSLSGIYTNTEDEACSITGSHNRDLEIALLVDCPEWDINLNGISTQKGTAISGRYKDSNGNTGKFLLLKNRPVLTDAKAKKS
jgi:hypothetical protein